MGMKYCSGCKSTKELSSFSRNKAMHDGLANWCKDCHRQHYTSAHGKERRVAHRDRTWEHSLVVECRTRARKRGLPFDLTDEDIIVPEVCPVLGIRLSRTRGMITDNTPTADRLIQALGYVKGNVQIISWKANRIKNNCDDPEVFEAIARYIRRSWKFSTGKASRGIGPENISGDFTPESSDGPALLHIDAAAKQ